MATLWLRFRASRSRVYGLAAGAPFAPEVVGGVHLERVDPVGRDEGHDLDRLGGRERQVGQVLVGDRDDRAVRVLVPLADLRRR